MFKVQVNKVIIKVRFFFFNFTNIIIRLLLLLQKRGLQFLNTCINSIIKFFSC